MSGRRQCLLDCPEIGLNEVEQTAVADIASGNYQQALRTATQRSVDHKVRVLRDDDRFQGIGVDANGLIGGSVSRGQVQGMNGFMPEATQLHDKPTWQLGINQKPHDTSGTVERVLARWVA